MSMEEDFRLRLPEIPAAVGTACGLKYGPPARFEARKSSPVSKHVPRCKPILG
ncbi:hypothetical protein ACUIJQ_11305 [Levilactobacillus hammesii]